MFLCLLERKFPELFKTHPTFFSSALQKAKKSKYAKFTLLFGAPCSGFKRAQKNCWGIYYQMEPPVGSKSQQDTKWVHSWTIHYFTYLSPPCISYILETQRYLGIVPEPFALSSLSWGLEMSRQQSCMLVAHAIIVSALVQKIWFFFQTLFGPKARTWDLLGQGTWAYYSIKIIKSDRFLSSRIIFLALNLKMFWINKSASRKARVTRHVYIYC